MEKGMHCTDCHYYQDSHGNTKLYSEVRAAIEIQCIDCHGTADESLVEKIEHQITVGEAPRLPTSGPAAPSGGTNLLALRTTFGTPRFEVLREPGQKPRLIQRSTVEPDLVLGGHADRRHDSTRQQGLQRQITRGQVGTHGRRWQTGMGRHVKRGPARLCPPKREHVVHRLSQFVEPQLLWVSFAPAR